MAAQSGQVPAYQARHIAKTTNHLSFEHAAAVDQQLAPTLGAVPWARLQTLLDAAIYQADPDGAEQKAAAAAQDRFVRLGRASEHGLKLIIARATAGDAIWFKATIDRIAEILATQGDTDTIDIRRSKAIGILAQPAQALQLLCQHQHDDWDGPAEPADCDAEPSALQLTDLDPGDPESFDAVEQLEGELPGEDGAAGPQPHPADAEQDGHRSLQPTAPPFNPDRARPRATVYVHLSGQALTAGTGIARVENVGPVLLGRLRLLLGDRCTINLKPVIDLPAGHTPVDPYELPASLREHIQLRNPADVSVRRRSQPIDRRGPHHPLPQARPRRPARPNQNRQPRTADTPPPPTQNPRRLPGPTTRTRHLDMAITPQAHLPRQRHRHPSPRPHPVRRSNMAADADPPQKLAS